MQKGIATLEIILVVLIIAILTTTTLPNIANILDKVTLDYETKRLYTNMRFLQSFDRNFTMPHNSDFGDNSKSKDQVQLIITGTNIYYFTKSNTTAGDIQRYYLGNGVTFSKNRSEVWRMQFDDMGKIEFYIDNVRKPSHTLNLVSKFGKKTAIVIDSVGRFKFERGT